MGISSMHKFDFLLLTGVEDAILCRDISSEFGIQLSTTFAVPISTLLAFVASPVELP